MPVDLAAPDGPGALVERAMDEHGRVDVLVNNVGAVRLRLEGFLGTSDEEFEWAMQMNFFTALRATRPPWSRCSNKAAARSSTSPRSTPSSSPTPPRSTTAPPRPRSSTSASRWRRSSGRRASASTASRPGPVATDLWLGEHGVAATVADATGVDADTARATVIAGIGGFATGRFTTPEEVATLVVMLASERTANVTGANYVIDGGLIKTT